MASKATLSAGLRAFPGGTDLTNDVGLAGVRPDGPRFKVNDERDDLYATLGAAFAASCATG